MKLLPPLLKDLVAALSIKDPDKYLIILRFHFPGGDASGIGGGGGVGGEWRSLSMACRKI